MIIKKHLKQTLVQQSVLKVKTFHFVQTYYKNVKYSDSGKLIKSILGDGLNLKKRAHERNENNQKYLDFCLFCLHCTESFLQTFGLAWI